MGDIHTVYKSGQCIINRQTKQVYEITAVWGFPAHVEARYWQHVGHENTNIYFFLESILSRDFTVLDETSMAARLLYRSNGTKAVTNGKPTEP